MTVSQFQTTILKWFEENRRELSWRNTTDPYKILVSEVMLQQTQVSRVILKYELFLKEFPDLQSLAASSDKKLLKVWQGLGYWRRARFLRETAQAIITDHNKTFPRDIAMLQTLPGIGPYTAAAIACFAFHNPAAFIDTNIRRVYLHFFFKNKKNVSDKEILKIAEQAVWKKNPREWHYALFDYGALVLKDKKINRQSKHYAKQSRFAGSFRAFRTSIMRFLLDQPRQTATKSKMRKVLLKAESPYGIERILSSLLKDGLLKKKGSYFSL